MHVTSRKILPGLTLTMATLLSACGESNKTPEQYVADATAYYEQGKLSEAQIELKNALKENPNLLEARRLLGTIALETGDAVTAEKEFEQAIKLGLAPSLAQLPMVRSLLLQKDYDRVIDATDAIAQNLPAEEKAAVLSLRGTALLELDQEEEARLTFEQALEIKPDSADGMLGLAKFHAMQEERFEAQQWIDRVLEIDPDNASAWSLLGTIELAESNLDAAIEALTKAVDLRGYPSLDRARRALAYIEKQDFENFEADIDTLKQQKLGNDAYVAYIAGIGYFKQGKYSEADQYFQRAYTGSPDSVPLLIYLAATHLALGNSEQALQYANKGRSAAPQFLAAQKALGTVQLANNEISAAKKTLEDALKKDPSNLTILRMLAGIANIEEDTEATVRYLNLLAELDPGSDETRMALNIARMLDDQPLDPDLFKSSDGTLVVDTEYDQQVLMTIQSLKKGEAREAFDRAVAMRRQWPNKPGPLNLLASVHLSTGNWNGARGAYNTLLNEHPDNLNAARNLALLEARAGNLEQARDLLKPAVEKQPQDESATLLLAELENLLGNATESIRLQEEFLVWDPQARAIVGNLSEAYFRDERYQDLLKITGELTEEQHLQSLRLLELRGKSQLLSGDPATAARSFRLLVEQVPESGKAHYAYADALIKMGSEKRGLEQLEKAVALDTNYFPARLALVRLQADPENPEEVVRELEKLRQQFGEQPELLGFSGWMQLEAGNYAEAEQLLSKAAKALPDTGMTRHLVNAMWLQGKREEAIKHMQDWLDQHPKDLVILQDLATAFLLDERSAEAIKTYRSIAENYPKYYPALNDLAYLLGEDGQTDSALKYAKQAHDLAPDDPVVMDTLGVLLVRSDDPVKGTGLIRKAAEKAPENQDIQLHLAQAYQQQEKFDEAREAFEDILLNAPRSAQAEVAAEALKTLP